MADGCLIINSKIIYRYKNIYNVNENKKLFRKITFLDRMTRCEEIFFSRLVRGRTESKPPPRKDLTQLVGLQNILANVQLF